MARGATDIELVKGGGGVFEIVADETNVFSKKETGRFPTDDEVDALVTA